MRNSAVSYLPPIQRHARRAGVAALCALLTMAAKAEDVVFRHVNVVPMDSETVLHDYAVLVRDGTIVSLRAEAPGGTDSSGAVQIDARGKYLLPGLAEMHAHIPSGENADYVQEVLTLYLTQGITTIRGMLGEPTHLELRRQQLAGELDAPRILAGGPSLNGNTVSSPENGAQQVREQHTAGYDHLKLHPGLTRAAFDAIATQAQRLKMPFTGHVSLEVGAQHAIASRQTTIEHMDDFVRALLPGDSPGKDLTPGFFGVNLAPYVDPTRVEPLARAVANAGVWVVPTEALMVRLLNDVPTATLLAEPGMRYVSQQTKQQWRQARENRRGSDDNPATRAAFLAIRRQLIKSLQEVGAGILLGSDAPQIFNVPGFSMHDELDIYVEAGLTPFEALGTGTTNVARYQGLQARRGKVAEGFDADLVLLQGNPLQDIANTRKVAGVMVAGRWYGDAWLADKLKAIAQRYDDTR